MKTRQMGAIPPSAILSRQGIARYGGVSRIGPLSGDSKRAQIGTNKVRKKAPSETPNIHLYFRSGQDHRVLQGAPPRGATTLLHLSKCSRPLFFGFGKRGLLEKGAFQQSPFSGDSREFKDSSVSGEPPDCGKERRFRPFSRDSRDFR